MSNIEIGCVCVAIFCICSVVSGVILLLEQFFQLDGIKVTDGEPFEVSKDDFERIEGGEVDKERLFGDKIGFGECVFSVRAFRQKGKYMCYWKHAKERKW